MKIRPQLHKTADGTRWINHAVYSDSGVFLAYGKCRCICEAAIKELNPMGIADMIRNWLINLRYFVCRRSNDIGGGLLIAALILILIYFGPDILGGE